MLRSIPPPPKPPERASATYAAAARGEALGDDLSVIAGTSLDKGVELDALAKVATDER